MNAYLKILIALLCCLKWAMLPLVTSAQTPTNPVTVKVLKVFQSDGPSSAQSKLVGDWDMAGLKALPQHSFTTHTPWFKQAVTFTGPLVRDVLSNAKVKGVTLTAMALDEYKSKIPLSDVHTFDVILAHSINGEPLNPKNKGPLFIVYPYDSKKELQSVLYYQRSVWQLTTLTVE